MRSQREIMDELNDILAEKSENSSKIHEIRSEINGFELSIKTLDTPKYLPASLYAIEILKTESDERKKELRKLLDENNKLFRQEMILRTEGAEAEKYEYSIGVNTLK